MSTWAEQAGTRAGIPRWMVAPDGEVPRYNPYAGPPRQSVSRVAGDRLVERRRTRRFELRRSLLRWLAATTDRAEAAVGEFFFSLSCKAHLDTVQSDWKGTRRGPEHFDNQKIGPGDE